MIKPHGSDELNPLFVYDSEQRHALIEEAKNLPALLLNSAAAANAVKDATGKRMLDLPIKPGRILEALAE